MNKKALRETHPREGDSLFYFHASENRVLPTITTNFGQMGERFLAKWVNNKLKILGVLS